MEDINLDRMPNSNNYMAEVCATDACNACNVCTNCAICAACTAPCIFVLAAVYIFIWPALNLSLSLTTNTVLNKLNGN